MTVRCETCGRIVAEVDDHGECTRCRNIGKAGVTKRVSPFVGWLIGIAAGVLAFVGPGSWLAFQVSYANMHGGYGETIAPTIIILAVVVAACAAFAYIVKRAITRRR